MGCNGNGHSADCNCGWGGEWHGNYNIPTNHNDVLSFYSSWWTSHRRSNYESYINPNASCPVCGTAVYFFQSSNGGRVFFDELGPPWLKHPCTDNSEHLFTPKSYFPPAGILKKEKTCQDDGWEPVEILSCLSIGKFTIVKIKRIDTDGMEFYLAAIDDSPVDRDALVFIRESDNLGVFDFSYLDTLKQKIEVKQTTAYRNCFTMMDFECWERAVKNDSAEDQNKIAFNLLFTVEAELQNESELEDKNIDYVAATFWLRRAEGNGLRVAAENLKMIDLIRLKHSLQGKCNLKAEDFNLQGRAENDIAAE